MEIKFKKLIEGAATPYRATEGAAGFDLVATSRDYDGIRGVLTYGTGLAFEIPAGYVGLLFSRSSVYKSGLHQTNCVGVLDSDYRGEVSFKFYRLEHGAGYSVGDRIGQIVVMPVPVVSFVSATELSYTDRGNGGHGSTGR